ncbi:hypothetical protein ACFSM5_15290 [Lacibacterium aquatile]|uniref:Uncharacterized protein n=1 Tax=Lacibacterium aquatile TaxID=1168082 RepID=A0ABW5DUW7_9PROT
MNILACSSVLLSLICMPVAAATDKPAKAPPKPAPSQSFADIGAAEKTCGKDKVVWFNPASGIFFESGNKFFGKTKTGGYSCRETATGSGYRSSKNRT